MSWLKKKFNTYIFHEERAFVNFVWQMSAILFSPQYCLSSLVPKQSQVSLSQEDLYTHNKDLSQLEKITGHFDKDWLPLLW